MGDRLQSRVGERRSRRGFLGLGARETRPPGAREESGAPGNEPAALPDAASTQFSLTEFYRARGPQKLPPIAIRPEVLHCDVPTTRVGAGQPPAPPDVSGDPLYAELSRPPEEEA